MSFQAFDISNYFLNYFAIPHLFTALFIAILSVKRLLDEGITRARIAITFSNATIFIWLFSVFLAYCSHDKRIALWWARAAYLGIAFIPSSVYYFIVVVLKLYSSKKFIVWSGWLLSCISAFIFIGTDIIINGTHMQLFPWGYYAQYSIWILPYLLFFVSYLAFSVRLLRKGYSLAKPDSALSRRSKLFFIALFVGSVVGMMDYLPGFGIGVPPYGSLAVFVAVIIFNKTITKYRLVDITPKFAAQNIIDTMNEALLVLEPEGIVRLTNHAAEDLLGIPQKDILEKNISVIMGDAFFHDLGSGSLIQSELSYRNPHRGMLTLGISVSRMTDDKENLLAIILIARDISEKKRAEDDLLRAHEELEIKVRERTSELSSLNLSLAAEITERKQTADRLRQSEQFIRSILDSVDEGFIVVDRDLRILTANKAYCRLYNDDCGEVIGRHCYEISHGAQRPCYQEGEDCAPHRVFDTGDPCVAIHRHTDAKGGTLYLETKAFPIKDNSGAVMSVIETVNDITEKHLLEEERLKTQKLEAIGTLAGGIAHDFNNLLQGIFGYISMAKMALDQKERSLAMLEQAEKALHMSVNLTTQLLTFSKGGRPVKTKVPLQPIIESSIKFALSGSRVDYRIKLDEKLWAVRADEGQIGQVIQNIVLNAEQAMPAGGTITITGRNVLSPNKGLPQLLKEGKYVEITVRDNGTGIPTQYLDKIFDPYFTTKEKGSGLGLATSYSIIKNHGGLIDVTSVPGKGTTVFIYLPSVEAEIEIKEPSAVSSGVHKGKILVMDDEEMIRNIAGELITVLGHEVELAEHGEAAIEKYKSAVESGKPFDIVILDLTIRGGMGGGETIEQLLLIDPAVRAIVSSGYSDDDTLSDFFGRGFKACLTKPYNLDKLRDTLNGLLEVNEFSS